MFDSLSELIALAETQGQLIHEVVIAREVEQSSRDQQTVWDMMHKRLLVMRESAGEGISRPVQSLSGISGGNAWRLWQ